MRHGINDCIAEIPFTPQGFLGQYMAGYITQYNYRADFFARFMPQRCYAYFSHPFLRSAGFKLYALLGACLPGGNVFRQFAGGAKYLGGKQSPRLTLAYAEQFFGGVIYKCYAALPVSGYYPVGYAS